MNKTVSVPLIVALLVTSLFMLMNPERAFDKGVVIQVTLSAFSIAAIAVILLVYARAEKDSDAKLGSLVREHFSTLVPVMGIAFITGAIDLATFFSGK